MVENISFIREFPGDKVRETIVVGIGYPLNDLSDRSRLRTYDLTPTIVPAMETATRNMLIRYTGNENITVSTNVAISRFYRLLRSWKIDINYFFTHDYNEKDLNLSLKIYPVPTSKRNISEYQDYDFIIPILNRLYTFFYTPVF